MIPRDQQRDAPSRIPIFVIFIASGAAGLFYQVVWTRLLTLVFGSTIFAVSAVLTAFMAGLGLGSFVLSRWADRGIRPLRIYSILEILIGLYALLFPLLLKGIQSGYIAVARTGDVGFTPLVLAKFLMGVGVLLLPTALMGGTLPLLSRYLVRSLNLATREIAYLYALNTAGATLGTFIAGFLLIPQVGLKATMFVAVTLNIAAGAVALFLSRNESPFSAEAPETGGRESAAPRRPKGIDPSPRRQVRLALVIMFFSGLFALVFEVVWTRILLLYMGSTTYTFSTMLTTFLFGIAAGSYFIGLAAPRIKRPFLLLALVEIGIGASIFITAPAMWKASAIMESPAFSQLSWETYNLSKFALCFGVMLLPTLLMGATFPLATQVVLRSPDEVGRSVGNVYSVNTLGAIIGSMAAGLLLIPVLGLGGTFAVASLGNMALGGAAIFSSGNKRLLPWGFTFAAPALALVLLHASVTKLLRQTVIERIAQTGSIVFEGDGLEAHVAVDQHAFGYRQLWINGDIVAKSTASVSGHNMLGHLPMLLAEENKDVLVIALGTGISAGSTSLYEPETLDIVEISELVVENVHLFWFDNHDLVSNPKANFVVDDGRNFVQTAKKTYDVVAAEPLQPWKVGVANLYTREYYEACRRLLNTGGVAVQWIPLHGPSLQDVRDLTKTFVEVFPETSFWIFGFDVVLLGHEADFAVDLPDLESRMSRSRIREDLAEVNVTGSLDLLNHLVLGPREIGRFIETGRVMSDWFPFIEYEGPRHVHENLEINESFLELMRWRCDPATYVTAWSDEDSQSQRIRRQNVAWRLTHEGVIAQNRGMLEESRERLEEAVSQAPWLGDSRFYLSRTYFMLSDRIPLEGASDEALSKAHAQLSRALELTPDSRSVLARQAMLADRLQLRQETIEYCRRLLDVLPPFAPMNEPIKARLEHLENL